MNKISRKIFNKKTLLTAGLVGTLIGVTAKERQGVIMTVDGEDIPTEEFLYLYQKNNQQQAAPQTLEEYFPLFEMYRLKVAEAKKEGVDTTEAFRKEIDVYRRELLEPYVTDTVFFNQLIDIAQERENTVVESSHIMIIKTHNEAKDAQNYQLLDSIRTELLNGGDFITFARAYSQDRFSSDKGGYLGYNPAGSFPYSFETAVYETPEGDISEIVESHVGWHIVKSGGRKPSSEFNRPAKSREEVKADVQRKVSSPFDSRYHDIRNHTLDILKGRHPELTEEVEGLDADGAYELLMGAEEISQYNNNADYRNLVDEYVNGSLLYEVSVKNVWDKAGRDEDGLQRFYDANRGNYQWSAPHLKGVLIQALNDSVASEIKVDLEGGSLVPDKVVELVRNKYGKTARADIFNVEKGANPLVEYLMFGEGEEPVKKTYKELFIADGRVVEQPEGLNDVRNQVINDYQDELQREWESKLKGTHEVVVNQKELDRVIKKLKK